MKGVCLLLLLMVSLGNCEDYLAVQNCTGETPFKDIPATDVYYSIVRTNSSACMHYVWSTKGYPALYLARTTDEDFCKCSAATYNKTAFPGAGSISIPGLNGSFSLAFIFTRLVEFNGTEKYLTVDSINITSACSESFSTSNRSAYSQFRLNNETIRWNFTIEDMTFKGSLLNTSDKPFSFSIKINFPTSATERLKYFPKTLFTENSTTFDIISENYQFTKNIGEKDNYSRLALEVVVLHGKNVKNGSILLKWTNDDEYTPSVFSSFTYNMSAPLGGFAQWKPIAYQSSKRKSTASQQVFVLPTGLVEECQLKSVPEGLASALYGSDVNGAAIGNITRWFAVFGTSGDDSYIRPDYNTWTVVTGYGQIPEDHFSVVIIITIFVGVGVPAVLVVLGGVYVFIRKKPWENIQRMVNSKRGRGYSRLS